MELGEELILQARAEAAQREPSTPLAAALEALRAEAVESFDELPEPPAYRKADDPARRRAQELLPKAKDLLVRLIAAAKAAPGEPRLPLLEKAAEAHLRALAAIAAGEITQGEHLCRAAWEAVREASGGVSFSHVQSLSSCPVYDRATGRSRYDPQPEPMLTVQVFCPNQGCQKAAAYSVAPRYAMHRFTCTSCRRPFTGHFAEVKSAEARPQGKAVHHILRVVPVGGGDSVLEFDDASGGEITLAPRDLVVLLYSEASVLGAVENLTSGSVLWIWPKGPCFLATAVYGPEASELDDFRRFRDRILLPLAPGRALVQIYYRVGPALASGANRRPWLRRAFKAVLEPVRRAIRQARSE